MTLSITKLTLAILVAGIAFQPSQTVAQNGQKTDTRKTEFEEPVFLTVGDAPMNNNGDMMYPSPVIVDIDGDGQEELVIGTIFGGVYVCENGNPGTGTTPDWSEPTPVKTVDDEPLNLNNW